MMRRLLLLIGSIVLMTVGGLLNAGIAQAACADSWKNAVSGDWNTPANWSRGCPGVRTDACIAVAGTYTVSIEGSASANSVTVGTSSGSQTLTVGDGSVERIAHVGERRGQPIDSHGTLVVDSSCSTSPR